MTKIPALLVDSLPSLATRALSDLSLGTTTKVGSLGEHHGDVVELGARVQDLSRVVGEATELSFSEIISESLTIQFRLGHESVLL